MTNVVIHLVVHIKSLLDNLADHGNKMMILQIPSLTFPLQGKNLLKMTAFMACMMTLGTAQASANENQLLQQYKLALANDATLAATSKRHQSTMLLEDIADAAFLPTLSATANATSDLVTSQTSDSYSVSLGINLVLESVYAKGVAETSIQQSAQNLKATQQDIILQTLTRYFEVVKKQVDIDSIEAQIRASEKNLATTKKQAELGLSTPLQVANIENNAQQLALNLLQTKQQLHVARNTLALSTGVYVNNNLPGLADNFEAPHFSSLLLDEWWELAQKNNLALHAQKLAVEKSYQSYQQMKASSFPTGRIAYNHLSNTNNNITLSISGNIYDFGLKSAQSKQSKLGWHADQDILKSTTDSIRQQIDNTLMMLQNSHTQIDLLASVLMSAENTFSATQQEFELGLKEKLDVLKAEQQIATNHANLLKARYDHLLLQANLKKLAGTLNETDLINIDQQLNTPS